MKTLTQGVSGSGKSTVGKEIAAKLALPFIDGDDLHPKENIDKMSRGEPLNDRDRGPWLRRIREEAIKPSIENSGAHDESERPTGLIVACSALKKSYRDVLRGCLSVLTNNQAPDVATVDGNVSPGGLHPDEPLHPSILPTFFVHLTGSHDTLYKRMESRKGHYMKKNMLDSQFRTLELPSDEEMSEDVIQLDIDAITDTGAQVEFALSAIDRLTKDRPIIEHLCTNHPATTMRSPGAQVSVPGLGGVGTTVETDRHSDL